MRLRYFFTITIISIMMIDFCSSEATANDALSMGVSSHTSQMSTKPDSIEHWAKMWVLSLNGSQASYSNWSQGNYNSVAVTGGNMFNATYKQDRYSFDILINARYGQTKINGSEVRKTDDLIHFKNRVNHLFLTSQYTAYFEVDFRTQFDAGYDKKNVYISNFISPGYLQETAGLGYKPVEYVQLQSGLTLKQTFVADTLLSRQYGVTLGKNFRSEGGFSVGVSFKKNIAKNLTLTSNVQSFTNFLQSLNHTDVILNNEFTGKINNFMSTNIQFSLMYDRDFNKQIQVKQVLAVGLSFNVF